jgi:hypothetical protein
VTKNTPGKFAVGITPLPARALGKHNAEGDEHCVQCCSQCAFAPQAAFTSAGGFMRYVCTILSIQITLTAVRMLGVLGVVQGMYYVTFNRIMRVHPL